MNSSKPSKFTPDELEALSTWTNLENFSAPRSESVDEAEATQVLTVEEIETIQKQAYDEAFELGKQQGYEQGLKQGYENGLQQGLETGQKEGDLQKIPNLTWKDKTGTSKDSDYFWGDIILILSRRTNHSPAGGLRSAR